MCCCVVLNKTGRSAHAHYSTRFYTQGNTRFALNALIIRFCSISVITHVSYISDRPTHDALIIGLHSTHSCYIFANLSGCRWICCQDRGFLGLGR